MEECGREDNRALCFLAKGNPWLRRNGYWVHRTKDIKRVREKYSRWCYREEIIGTHAHVRQGALHWL